ncbi:hypothetical protein C4B60_18850 [Jeotgalibacillus proteolyticus]|uniref:Uncharacterized protein n=1 Tax=Jeotgalibacillus proteolyticus TaxID=2082395 RepID=A0A2S5G7K8_9BACL|nr:hypothetical protein C4B60_18850 [Jeotgalibacillus proteolyticus]
MNIKRFSEKFIGRWQGVKKIPKESQLLNLCTRFSSLITIAEVNHNWTKKARGNGSLRLLVYLFNSDS